MLLNDFGEPVAPEEFAEKQLDLRAPLLLASPNTSLKNVPEDWCGIIYTTRRVIKESKDLSSASPKRIGELEENKPTEIRLPNGSRISITPFSWSIGRQETKLIFLLKDEYITRICIDVLANTLNSIISNNVLRKAIKEGVDVVHLNDSFAIGANPRDPKIHHTWFRLHLLIYLIRPKKYVDYTKQRYLDIL
ncbi:unnamed protein product [Ceratitis capitata]|uniref:(Mediterranean fruit fly) hypothetical protein n=1 Tax=Ceratitis capitata TaxID=7213 RepID=A0A811VG91_CERCA|nr:unnamed protein product [Ceratitis capitata]